MLVMRLVIFLPLIAFGVSFFKGDSYFRNPGLLAGIMFWFGNYFIITALIWGNNT
jgi:hypothetical protein